MSFTPESIGGKYSFFLTARQTPYKACGEEAGGFGLTISNNQGFDGRVAVTRATQEMDSINHFSPYEGTNYWRRIS